MSNGPATLRSRDALCVSCRSKEQQLLLADTLARELGTLLNGVTSYDNRTTFDVFSFQSGDALKVALPKLCRAFDAYSEARVNSEIARGVE